MAWSVACALSVQDSSLDSIRKAALYLGQGLVWAQCMSPRQKVELVC
jgi:hypothetical protein